jgi:hypothetical protein
VQEKPLSLGRGGGEVILKPYTQRPTFPGRHKLYHGSNKSSFNAQATKNTACQWMTFLLYFRSVTSNFNQVQSLSSSFQVEVIFAGTLMPSNIL